MVIEITLLVRQRSGTSSAKSQRSSKMVGTVLIPSFALGRAQEIILILKNAMANQIISEFPVYIDGLVNEICRAL